MFINTPRLLRLKIKLVVSHDSWIVFNVYILGYHTNSILWEVGLVIQDFPKKERKYDS